MKSKRSPGAEPEPGGASPDGGPFFDPDRFGPEEAAAFRAYILAEYRAAPRAFPWRETRDPWAILVSEVMLQQTQTDRVVPKYLAFLKAFPGPAELAAAPLAELLALWSGLGYNRRALALKRAAEAVAARPGRAPPEDEAGLRELPGVGPYTARAVLAFAFGRPTVFIETNIRSVFLHHFFPGAEGVGDARLEPLVRASLDEGDPRTWYYALMDRGVAIKKRHGNPNRRSAHHATQGRFEDSHRRIRGAALRLLGERGRITRDELAGSLPFARERVERAADELVAEGFARERDGTLFIGE